MMMVHKIGWGWGGGECNGKEVGSGGHVEQPRTFERTTDAVKVARHFLFSNLAQIYLNYFLKDT